ncbi:MAG: leucine-rich repeat domain-containing protein, partial [Paludibacteraceae bacterium]|nr:leucine-rich repeat domain-containing protein [Paludibacteraceae bacterium]
LTSLTIGNSVTSIGDRAFGYCSDLTSITIPNSVISIGDYAFQDCSGLTSITIPNSVTSIGNLAFSYCSGLTSLTIGNSVTSIGDGAFYGCNYLTNLSIPASVSQIGDYGFAFCNRLQAMYVDAVVPPMVATETFTDVSRSIPVYVPDVSVADYQAAPIWCEFNIVGQSQSGTSLDTINSTTNQPVKVIENGQLYILLPDGTRYDATGKKVE